MCLYIVYNMTNSGIQIKISLLIRPEAKFGMSFTISVLE